MEDYKVGDVLYASGGYNRTDVEFYEITKMTEKRMELALLEQKVVSGDPFRTYYVEPTKVKTSINVKAFINKFGSLMIIGRKAFTPRLLSKYDGKPKWANTGYAC